jgi:hypothetical protein
VSVGGFDRAKLERWRLRQGGGGDVGEDGERVRERGLEWDTRMG